MSGAQERPTPAWGHASGALAMRAGTPAPQGSPALERMLIVERASRYCWAYDERRIDLLAECFTPDAVWQGTVGGAHPVGPYTGREEILRWLTEFWPHQHHQPRHVLLGTVVEQQSRSTALTLSYLLLSTARRGQVAISTTGFYRLALQRAPEGWQVAHLYAGFDAPFWPGKLERMSERGRLRHGLLPGERD